MGINGPLNDLSPYSDKLSDVLPYVIHGPIMHATCSLIIIHSEQISTKMMSQSV